MEAVQKCMALCQRDRTAEYRIRYHLCQYSTDDPVPYPGPEDAPKLLRTLLVSTFWYDMYNSIQLSDSSFDQFKTDRTSNKKRR